MVNLEPMNFATAAGANDTGSMECSRSSRVIFCTQVVFAGRSSGESLRFMQVAQSNYQLPNGPVKAGRRWGQRHPQGANLGSNGILKFLSKTHTTAATSPP